LASRQEMQGHQTGFLPVNALDAVAVAVAVAAAVAAFSARASSASSIARSRIANLVGSGLVRGESVLEWASFPLSRQS
jgi:hypothetical protein